ncbi:alpha/beta fold hydrolase [Aquabacterium sp.]|uniref:alpha/beta hydrolase family protein n=1 Tax=Aquabacterium sp. TaxID=1872578 RepID=UPI003B758CA0
MEHLTLHTDDGHTLAARCYRPAPGGAAHRVVFIGSALGVPQSFYERYARWLAEHGAVVYTLDWRGIGASAPKDLRRYRARLIDWALQDAPALMKLAQQRHPDLPMSWFGHSMGGILYGLMPQLPQVDHVVTLGSGSGYHRHLAKPLRYGMGLFWHVMVPLSVARHGYFAGKRLNAVGDLPKGIIAQWKRWCASPEFVCSEGGAVKAAYACVTRPIRAVLFTDDKLASEAGIRAVHQPYTSSAVRYDILHPQDIGATSVGHFDFFHTRIGPRGWAHSLTWLGLSANPQQGDMHV